MLTSHHYALHRKTTERISWQSDVKLKHLSAFGLAGFVCSALNNEVYVCPSSEAFVLISQTVLLRDRQTDRQTDTERAGERGDGGGGGGEKEERTESQPAKRTNWHKETRQTKWHRETRQTDKLA